MIKPKYGQHFLFDGNMLDKIVDAASISENDAVVEIGPGHGSLTKKLLHKAEWVVAVEIDTKIYEKIKRELSGYDNLLLLNKDALEFSYRSIGAFKVVSNIPYYITTPIVFKLLDERPYIQSMTLTVQKEVGLRIAAKPGGKSYGALSVMVQYRAKPEVKCLIPGKAFRPIPKVDSAVVHIEIPNRPNVEVKDERLFSNVVRTAFTQRRKTIANSLKSICRDIKGILREAGIEPSRRPETLSIEEFAYLTGIIKEGNYLDAEY